MTAAMGRRSGVWRSACLALLPTIATPATAETLILDPGFALGEFEGEDLAPGTTVDARRAEFRLANSANATPEEGRDCEVGTLPVVLYPFRVRDSVAVTVRGGRIHGEVPQTSDWVHTYCNSAAVQFRDSPEGRVEGLRARRLWDGIRFSGDSGGFRVSGVWLSEVRDDCIENDYLHGGLVADSLLDGCFVGLSVRPWDDGEPVRASGIVRLEGVILRLEPYPYRGERRHGFPLKADESSPEVAIHDSVIAMGDARSVSESRLNQSWDKLGDCSGNLFLWTSDEPWPDDLRRPPSCFRMLEGAEARAAWEAARRNWIDCHPSAIRFAEDPASNPEACDPSAYGGRT